MSMDNQVLLKSSMFGGFKKKDVLSYIFELNESTQDSQQKLQEQIEELTAARDELGASLAGMETKISMLQASLDDTAIRLDSANRKNAEASAMVESLNAQLAKYEQTLRQKSDELDRQAAMNSELVEKNRVHEQKRAQVEQAASQIKNLLEQAKTDAAKIVSQARDEAVKAVDAAKTEADDLIRKAKISAEEHISSAKDSISDTYKEFSDFLNETSMLQRALIDAAASVTAKMEALHSAVERARDTAAEKAGRPGMALEGGASPPPQAPAEPDSGVDCVDAANEILSQYGIRKDDSGFFRLSADR